MITGIVVKVGVMEGNICGVRDGGGVILAAVVGVGVFVRVSVLVGVEVGVCVTVWVGAAVTVLAISDVGVGVNAH
jgi:hypothetical protein